MIAIKNFTNTAAITATHLDLFNAVRTALNLDDTAYDASTNLPPADLQKALSGLPVTFVAIINDSTHEALPVTLTAPSTGAKPIINNDPSKASWTVQLPDYSAGNVTLTDAAFTITNGSTASSAELTIVFPDRYNFAQSKQPNRQYAGLSKPVVSNELLTDITTTVKHVRVTPTAISSVGVTTLGTFDKVAPVDNPAFINDALVGKPAKVNEHQPDRAVVDDGVMN